MFFFLKKNVFEDAERRFQKSISLPGSSTNKDEEMEALDMENNRAAFIQKNGWYVPPKTLKIQSMQGQGCF